MSSSRKRPEVSPVRSDESDTGRLSPPPKRAKAGRMKAAAEDRVDEGSADEEQPTARRSTRAHGRKTQETQRKDQRIASGEDADQESEEETAPIDKFGSSSAVAASVVTSRIPQLDFRETLKKSSQARKSGTPAKLVPRKIFLTKANNTAAIDGDSTANNDATVPNGLAHGTSESAERAAYANSSTAPNSESPSAPPRPPQDAIPSISTSPMPPSSGERSQVQYIPGFVHHPKHNYKAQDYDGVSKQIILRVCHEYEALIVSKDPFPDAVVSRVWFQKCWDGACSSLGVDITPDDNVRKLVFKRGSRIRGDMVNYTRNKMDARFGFKESKRKSIIRANVKKYDELIAEASYVYQNEAKQIGQCESKLVLTVLGHVLFGSRGTSIGVVYRKYFDPIPLVTLSLVYTMIRHCLGEWETGCRKPQKFSEEDVKIKRYLPHVKVVNDWVADDPEITQKLRVRWYKKMRALADIDDESAPVIVISEQARARARAALSQRTGDTDTEDDDEEEDA